MPTVRPPPNLRFFCLRRRYTTATPLTTLLHPTNPNLELSSHPPPYPPSTSLVIVPNFLTQSDQTILTTQADKRIRRLCRKGYSEGHFDGVITGYKECSLSSWMPVQPQSGDADEMSVRGIVARCEGFVEKLLAEGGGGSKIGRWLAPHALDLRDGESGIRAHVDNVQVNRLNCNKNEYGLKLTRRTRLREWSWRAFVCFHRLLLCFATCWILLKSYGRYWSLDVCIYKRRSCSHRLTISKSFV